MTGKDIFDKMAKLPRFRFFRNFYKKYKVILLYLFWGGLTTVISIFIYALLNVSFRINELISNILSWFISVLFAC